MNFDVFVQSLTLNLIYKYDFFAAARVNVNLDLDASAPRITSAPRNADIREEMFIEFTCVAIGHPYPDITW